MAEKKNDFLSLPLFLHRFASILVSIDGYGYQVVSSYNRKIIEDSFLVETYLKRNTETNKNVLVVWMNVRKRKKDHIISRDLCSMFCGKHE